MKLMKLVKKVAPRYIRNAARDRVVFSEKDIKKFAEYIAGELNVKKSKIQFDGFYGITHDVIMQDVKIQGFLKLEDFEEIGDAYENCYYISPNNFIVAVRYDGDNASFVWPVTENQFKKLLDDGEENYKPDPSILDSKKQPRTYEDYKRLDEEEKSVPPEQVLDKAKVAKIRKFCQSSFSGIDTISFKKDGTIVAKRSYFYGSSGAEDKLAKSIQASMKDLDIDIQILGTDDEFKQWPKTSYYVVKFKIK